MGILRKQLTSSPLNKWILLISLIVLYGLHIRYSSNQLTIPMQPAIRADARDYLIYTYNLDVNKVFSRTFSENESAPIPDALRSPGFPLFASLFFSNTNTFVDRLLIIQTIFQVICFLILTIAIYKRYGGKIATLGALLLWTFPHFASVNTVYLTESLFLSLLAIALAISLKQKMHDTDYLILGLVIGFAALTKPTLEYFPLFFAIVLFIKKLFQKQHAFFLIASLTPIILWKLRNYFAIGSFSDPTLTVNTIYHGSFPGFMYNNDPATLGYAYRFDPENDNVYNGISYTLNLIWERALQNPDEYLRWYLFEKHSYLWQWDIFEGMGDIYIYPVEKSPWIILPDMNLIHLIHYKIHVFWVGASLFLSFFWIIYSKKNYNACLLFAAALIVYTILLHGIGAPYSRYGIPFKLCLIIVILQSIKMGIEYVKNRRLDPVQK